MDVQVRRNEHYLLPRAKSRTSINAICYRLDHVKEQAYRRRRSSIVITNLSGDMNSKTSTAKAVLMKPCKEACSAPRGLRSANVQQDNTDPSDPWGGFPQFPHEEQDQPRQSRGRLDHEQLTCPDGW